MTIGRIVRSIFLCAALGAYATTASAEDFPFTRNEFSSRMDTLSREKGIRAYLVQPRRCELRESSNGSVHFCEYVFFDTITRVWSKPSDDKVFMISSLTRKSTSKTAFVLGLSALISAMDQQLPDSEVSFAAEELAGVERTLSGKAELIGKDARYSSRITRDGVLFIAVR